MAGQPLDSDVLAVLQDPPPPVAPEVVSRDAQGQATVRATRLTAPLQIDGRLDEPVYETVRSITDFIQQLPDEGALGSERTQAWVLFDDDSIYISARCYDTAPPSAWVANEMRRDVIQLRQNDSFSLMLDTFYDRRNGLAFLVTPIGGFSDFAISNEGGRVNTDWNTIWDSRTDRFDGGWTVEIQIPFQSLRYRPTSTQVWGIQLRRIIRRRTEASYLTPLPISAARGNSVIAGLWHVSQAGAPTLFFSRRIGLQSGDAVPILAGGRLTGKIGAFDVGALNIQTDDERLSGAQTTNLARSADRTAESRLRGQDEPACSGSSTPPTTDQAAAWASGFRLRASGAPGPLPVTHRSHVVLTAVAERPPAEPRQARCGQSVRAPGACSLKPTSDAARPDLRGVVVCGDVLHPGPGVGAGRHQRGRGCGGRCQRQHLRCRGRSP